MTVTTSAIPSPAISENWQTDQLLHNGLRHPLVTIVVRMQAVVLCILEILRHLVHQRIEP